MRLIGHFLLRRSSSTMLLVACIVLFGGCSMKQPAKSRSPAEVRAQIVRLLPAKLADRNGWATDIQAAFAAQRIDPTTQNLCATLAIAEQESSFHVDPAVPGMGMVDYWKRNGWPDLCKPVPAAGPDAFTCR